MIRKHMKEIDECKTKKRKIKKSKNRCSKI